MKAEAIRTINGWLTLVWVALVPPTLLFWSNSLPWLCFMSIWANVASHAAGWVAGRAEVAAE